MKKILTLLIFNIILFAHPVNLTKMSWDLNNSILKIRFVSFNMEKPIHLSNYPDEQEVLKNKSKMIEYTQKHLKIYSNDNQCNLIPAKFTVKNEIVIDETFKVKCNSQNNLKINFNMFFKYDKTQHGVMNIIDKNESVLLFKLNEETHKINTKQDISFKDFIVEGMWHIWLGIDHLVFLLMLIIPTIRFNSSIKTSLTDILKIVTAFTISHSITLSLSTFGIINPPENLIEILIAVSIFLTALNNIHEVVPHKYEWGLAFAFGFIHGFGFANALKELHLQVTNFASVVFGFNIGVEIGQIVIVLLVLPIVYFVIKKYIVSFKILSYFGAILSLLWIIDRTFSLKFMPF